MDWLVVGVAFLDFGMLYSLISLGTLKIALRMTLKFVVASVWVVLFSVYYRSAAETLRRSRSIERVVSRYLYLENSV